MLTEQETEKLVKMIKAVIRSYPNLPTQEVMKMAKAKIVQMLTEQEPEIF